MGVDQRDAPSASARNSCRLTNSARRASVHRNAGHFLDLTDGRKQLVLQRLEPPPPTARVGAGGLLRSRQFFRAHVLRTAGPSIGQPRHRSRIPPRPNGYCSPAPAALASTSNLAVVFNATPAMRLEARILDPSHNDARDALEDGFKRPNGAGYRVRVVLFAACLGGW